MDAPELFSANLRLIDQVARSVCRRRRMPADDAEDFVSSARLALLDDDYAILRQFEGRSSLASFLAVVFDRLISDQRVHALGRWHPSRAAERLGPAAVLLEKLVRRDHRSVDEALPIVRQLDSTLTRETAVSILAQLPDRSPRPRAVSLDEVEVSTPIAASDRSDGRTLTREARSLATRTSDVIRRTIAGLELEDRMLLRLHFGSKVSIADVGRMLRLPPRPLYRRLEALLRSLRETLIKTGLDSGSILELIGAATIEMNFGLESAESMEIHANCPSLNTEVAAAGDELS